MPVIPRDRFVALSAEGFALWLKLVLNVWAPLFSNVEPTSRP